MKPMGTLYDMSKEPNMSVSRVKWHPRKTGVLVAVAAMWACSESVTRPESSMPMVPSLAHGPTPACAASIQVLEHGAAVSFDETEFSFTAIRGEELAVDIDYSSGDEFLEFQLDEASLLRYPDGTPFEDGDAIEITISIDPQCMTVTFGPPGLVFDPEDPGELSMDYTHAAQIPTPETSIRIYRQEYPGDPWKVISGPPDTLEHDVDADIDSFTRFALAL